MSLEPLLSASPAIQVHALGALAAFGLGLAQFAGRKGTNTHRLLGWTWVALMAAVALSSFFIHQIRQIGPFSAIHLLSLYTLAMLAPAVLAARRHDVRRHRLGMTLMFVAALVGAGLFTLLPGRIMGAVVFGWPTAPEGP